MRRQSGAATSNLSDEGSRQPAPELRAPGSPHAAATALSPGRNAGAGDRGRAQSKAAAGLYYLTDTLVTPSTAGSFRCRGKAAAARQSVRWRPSVIVSSPESIKSHRILGFRLIDAVRGREWCHPATVYRAHRILHFQDRRVTRGCGEGSERFGSAKPEDSAATAKHSGIHKEPTEFPMIEPNRLLSVLRHRGTR